MTIIGKAGHEMTVSHCETEISWFAITVSRRANNFKGSSAWRKGCSAWRKGCFAWIKEHSDCIKSGSSRIKSCSVWIKRRSVWVKGCSAWRKGCSARIKRSSNRVGGITDCATLPRDIKKGRLRLSSQSSFSCRDYWTRTSDLAPPRRVRYQLRQIPKPFGFCAAKVGESFRFHKDIRSF